MSIVSNFLNGVEGLTPTAQANTQEKKQLGQEDFLMLLTTQLAHQDPLKPLDNGEFIAQMAQFSSLDSLQQLQRSFDGLAASLTSNKALQASALVGRSVLVPSEIGYLPEGGEIEGAIDLPESAENVIVTISNKSGEIVRRMSLGQMDAGVGTFTWDGKNENGELMPKGKYDISATGNVFGKNESLNTGIYAHVDSVNLAQGTAQIVLNLEGLGGVPLSEVKEIGS